MCLAVPGQVITIAPHPDGLAMGRVRFGGIVREVCLAYVPEVRVGEWVIVHVGFAIGRVDEREAAETFRLLERAGALAELAAPEEPDGSSAGPASG